MHPILLPAVCMCAVFLASVVQAQPADTSDVINPTLRLELLKMGALDQEVREFVYRRQEQPDANAMARMRAVDAAHTERLKEIVAEHGWPGYSLVGKDGAHAAFLVVQHAPDWDFQEHVLPMLLKAYEQGEAEGQSVALLTDRVRVHNGKPQVYGTQYKIEDGEVVFLEIEDRPRVDERREAIGMQGLEWYRMFVEEASGLKDHGLLDDQ